MRLFLAIAMALCFPVVLVAQPKDDTPSKWDGPLFKPTARTAIYEFSAEPKVRHVGKDSFEITFTAKGECDVAVAVEDPAGRIARHIVYGVLGSNAPAP